MPESKPHQTGCRMCGNPKLEARGLCSRHYRRFKAKFESFDNVDDAIEFENRCLEQGWIAPKSKGGRPKEKDAFDIIAEEIIAEGNQDIDAAVKERSKRPSTSANKRKAKKTKS